MMNLTRILPGTLFTIVIAIISISIINIIPYHFIGPGVLALLIGMILSPINQKCRFFQQGIGFTSKKLLRLAIILMGLSLSFSQVLDVGKFSLIVMVFTLFTAFGCGYLFGRLLKMDWKLSSLISVGTGICGGSAIVAVAPVIEADDSSIAYAISATYVFDILMVILFPIMGIYLNMSDLGFGLWTGTAVNDTSSVVAAGFAFSDIAGNYSIIVKLTRTLAIVPVVLGFSVISGIKKSKAQKNDVAPPTKKVRIANIFPWFILLFICAVAIKSINFLPDTLTIATSNLSKFLMTMSLGAIGLKTNFKQLAKSGFSPMFHGFIISSLVVIVSLMVQIALGQI